MRSWVYTVDPAVIKLSIFIPVCRLDIDLCQEPVEHLFDAKIIPSALEDDDVTHRNPTTADSQKLTEKSKIVINA